jgi:putative acetyltransferase
MFAIRRYAESDHAAVRALFIAVNRALAPPDLREAFESYVTRSLDEEIDRLSDYYTGKLGAFFVAHEGETLAGMFGLEGLGTPAAELRRMYVAASFRKRGLARMMLNHAEHVCGESGTPVLTLSTSEVQQAALALYRNAGYRLVREETAAAQSNKTVGGDIRRYYFEKDLVHQRMQ